MTQIRIPLAKESSYQAGKQIYADGPIPPAELFKLVDFGLRPSDHKESLERAIKAGWLTILADGKVDLTEFSCRHYDKESAASSYQGQLATPRVNVNAGLPLSARHRINTKGSRADAMDARSFPSHYAKVTP